MNIQSIKKLAFFVNTIVLVLVFGLLAFFIVCDLKLLIYFSIPTVLVYVAGFFLIHKNRLYEYACMVFFWLTLYMGVTTVCLGYGCGFHLYCFSVIPITFVTKYMSYKLGSPGINPIYLSVAIAAIYLVCTGYAARHGAIYQLDSNIQSFFLGFNAISVFGFLIYYSTQMINSIIKSEEKLAEAAHTDRLTGLYNRRYVLERLDSMQDDGTAVCLAMADIDDFKKINDVYGHDAGDEVLKSVSETMRSECEGCTIARWGGEEFLIILPAELEMAEKMLEHMRESIMGKDMTFDGSRVAVTVTVGLSEREPGQSIDEWTKDVDRKLYIGKNSGKNKVVA